MFQQTVDVHAVVDYIILKLDSGRVPLNLLKLQKLLYYVQAWNLALKNARLFDGGFEAWVHGPVHRGVYNRFSGTHSLYSEVTPEWAGHPHAVLEALPPDARRHIDEVLEAYGDLSGTQLEAMTHAEDPWLYARDNLGWAQRSEALIDERLMRDYYLRQLQSI
ncbi:DUF4065 domain-containing protein [Burkholderia cenocepacia]|nr:DUF4065 domain-containing protein [Burkholderia cenocepacia]RRA14464.1 DUF4065 domain-containing protein [Burkholderia cenocepacia]